jgi:hypothetical protein
MDHPRPGKAEVVLAGTTHDDVVGDADTDVLQGLRDLVGCTDVLLGRVALLCGVTYAQPPLSNAVEGVPCATLTALQSRYMLSLTEQAVRMHLSSFP